MEQASTLLPEMRQELSLSPGTTASDGSPTWVLQDPVGNRFFQLTWPAFEILSRWHLKNPQLIVDSIANETTLTVTQDDIAGLLQFLSQQHLLRAFTPDDSARFERIRAATNVKDARWLLKNYLFFRLPLVRPTGFLQICAPYFNKVFTPRFWLAIAALLVVGSYLVSRQWDSFVHTFAAYSGVEALLGIGIALSFAKVLHEFGHALTANRYGCRVPTMGIAFLVMLPVLYTDTTDAWKLTSRKQRMHIGAAGMLAELVLAVVATLVWSFLPDGPFRAGVFLLATSTWVITLAINASPFMRFDGYFLLADWLNLPNLHERAFALGRWQLREWLFGWGDSIPEQFPIRRQRFLIAFAFGTAIYRAVLFLSIALLVYHLFFKLLGILLMFVELAWFIAYPVQREIKVWWQRRTDMRWHLPTYRTSGLLLVLVCWLVVPWQNTLRVPAVIGAEQAQGLYAVSAAQVKTPALAQGEKIKAGQLLVQLESPDLNYRLKLAQAKEQELRWQLEQQSLDLKLQSAGPALRKRWEGAQELVNGLQERIQQLTVIAPFDGVIVERNESLEVGSWVASHEKLFHIINPTGIKGVAYLNEAQLLRFAQSPQNAKARARFVAHQSGYPALSCELSDIDKINLSVLDQPYIATQFGGNIPTQANKDGTLVPLQALFRVGFHQCSGAVANISQELVGVASLEGDHQSLLIRGFNQGFALLRGESSF